jgi:hypothetical protein
MLLAFWLLFLVGKTHDFSVSKSCWNLMGVFVQDLEIKCRTGLMGKATPPPCDLLESSGWRDFAI